MGRQSLNVSVLAAVLFLGACGISWAQTGDPIAMERATERAIALGKTGELSDALAILEPHLSQPSPASAKACYVAGFLLKERFKRDALNEPKIAAVDRADAVRWLQLSIEMDNKDGTKAEWQSSATKALKFLGGTYYDEAAGGVRTFQPGNESEIFALLDAHIAVARFLDPSVDATNERTAFHKNLARAYRQWFESTQNPDHFEGVVAQYEQALDLSPRDVTATYNLAVNIYNRGVELIKSVDETTSLGEIIGIQEQSAAYFLQALPWFERADALEPGRRETLRGLMIVHHALFDDAQAEAYRVKLQNVLGQ